MSHVRRFDHVGITVAALDAVTAFFVALGLEVEGRTFVEGEFLDTVCGIPGSRTEIVMLKPPDDSTRWSSRASSGPTTCRVRRPHRPTSWDCATWPSRSTTCTRPSNEQQPTATGWWAASASTKGYGGWPTCAARRGSSSRWPSASAELREPDRSIEGWEPLGSLTEASAARPLGQRVEGPVAKSGRRPHHHRRLNVPRRTRCSPGLGPHISCDCPRRSSQPACVISAPLCCQLAVPRGCLFALFRSPSPGCSVVVAGPGSG
jgi:hypothetical protein